MKSVAERRIETTGRPSGFDYMQIVLAVLIAFVHSVGTSYGLRADRLLFQSEVRGLIRLILPLFFALSGFFDCWESIKNELTGYPAPCCGFLD